MGFSGTILENDAQQIVNAVKTTGTNWSTFGHIVDEIKYELSQLRLRRIKHVKMNANTTAHTIAQEAILCVTDRVWVEKISNCICGIISREILCPR